MRRMCAWPACAAYLRARALRSALPAEFTKKAMDLNATRGSAGATQAPRHDLFMSHTISHREGRVRCRRAPPLPLRLAWASEGRPGHAGCAPPRPSATVPVSESGFLASRSTSKKFGACLRIRLCVRREGFCMDSAAAAGGFFPFPAAVKWVARGSHAAALPGELSILNGSVFFTFSH